MEPRVLFYTVKQITPMLQMGERQVRDALHKGLIPARNIDGQWRIPAAAFLRWASQSDLPAERPSPRT